MMMMLAPTDRSSATKISINKEQVHSAVLTIEQWSHSQRCRLIERLIPLCSSVQLDMLWTVLQPSLHRDYFYAVKCRYPNYHFKRISTPDSRASKEFYHHFDREESFYLSATNDLGELRDDDGLTKKSHSSIAQYSEEKALIPITSSNRREATSSSSLAIYRDQRQRRPPSHRSIDLSENRSRRRKISSHYTPKTARSVTIRWTEHSIPSITTIVRGIRFEQLLHWFLQSWSESEQTEFIRRLIVTLDERQQYFTCCVIAQRHYRDFISLLPPKFSFEILNHLTLKELSVARQVSKTWKSIIDRQPELWKPKTKLRPASEHRRGDIDWEKVQKQRLTTKRNWTMGTAVLIKCAGHTERVLCICGNDVHLATGSLDRTIHIWILRTGKIYQTLVGHNKGVWAVKFLSNTLLISGAYDCTLKIWNINTGMCLRTLLSHSGPVWSLACSSVYCLSGSQDRTARLWRLPKCELLATFTGHTSSVFGVDLDQEHNLCATASADKTVRIWSLATLQCIKILYTTTDEYVMTVSLRYGYIAYAFGVHILAYRITLSETKPCTVQKVMETQEHRGRIESVQLILLNDQEPQPSLVSAGQDGLVKYWDFDSVPSRRTYNTQMDDIVKINCIYVDPMHIVTVGDDGLVKILDFSPRKS